MTKNKPKTAKSDVAHSAPPDLAQSRRSLTPKQVAELTALSVEGDQLRLQISDVSEQQQALENQRHKLIEQLNQVRGRYRLCVLTKFPPAHGIDVDDKDDRWTWVEAEKAYVRTPAPPQEPDPKDPGSE